MCGCARDGVTMWWRVEETGVEGAIETSAAGVSGCSALLGDVPGRLAGPTGLFQGREENHGDYDQFLKSSPKI